MADKEIFSVVYWADKRVAKFSERTDKIRMYNVLVARARAKHPLTTNVVSFQFRTATEILEDPVEIEWQIEGLLQRSGIMLLAGTPGVGKSQISMRALMAMAMGQEKFLGFPLQEGCQPCAFFSLEMPTVELKILFESMLKHMTPDERQKLDKYLLWHDAGLPINFRDKLVRQRVEKSIEENGIQTLAMDSLSKMGIRKLQDEEAIIEMMEWFDHLRFTYNTSIWIIHHNRKPNSDRKADSIDDVYGSRFLTAGATSIITMDRNGKKDLARLRFEKIRTAPEKPPMTVRRQPHNLDFMVEGIQAVPELVEAELESEVVFESQTIGDESFNDDF
jgi:RecA-family ATPase